MTIETARAVEMKEVPHDGPGAERLFEPRDRRSGACLIPCDLDTHDQPRTTPSGCDGFASFFRLRQPGRSAHKWLPLMLSIGEAEVYVQAPTLRAPDKRYYAFVGSPTSRSFPGAWKTGESASLCVTYVEIANTLKKQDYKETVGLWPSCLDATGRRHWGKRWWLDIDKDWMGK